MNSIQADVESTLTLNNSGNVTVSSGRADVDVQPTFNGGGGYVLSGGTNTGTAKPSYYTRTTLIGNAASWAAGTTVTVATPLTVSGSAAAMFAFPSGLVGYSSSPAYTIALSSLAFSGNNANMLFEGGSTSSGGNNNVNLQSITLAGTGNSINFDSVNHTIYNVSGSGSLNLLTATTLSGTVSGNANLTLPNGTFPLTAGLRRGRRRHADGERGGHGHRPLRRPADGHRHDDQRHRHRLHQPSGDEQQRHARTTAAR